MRAQLPGARRMPVGELRREKRRGELKREIVGRGREFAIGNLGCCPVNQIDRCGVYRDKNALRFVAGFRILVRTRSLAASVFGATELSRRFVAVVGTAMRGGQ